MKVYFSGEIEELRTAIDYIVKKHGLSVENNGVEIVVKKHNSGGYRILKTDQSWQITYGIIPDFCRAMCILIDGIKSGEKEFDVSAERKINSCGIMEDVSRNAVLRVEAAKDLIARIACMGMNTFMLYMEDIYKIEGYKYFGYMRGAYSEEELKEIDDYAQNFGVEVVACIQTLAHLSTTLRWPHAKGMRDNSDVLLVGEEKTYDFIDKMIQTISRSLRSRRIHIGMDEAWGLGEGNYKRKHGEVDKFKILETHLAEVTKITDKYGMEPIMWCDMYFRFASKTRQYYDLDAQMPENISDMIPKNMTMAYWDYCNTDVDVYRAMLRKLNQMNRKTAFFGGVWTWNGISVNYDKTFRTTYPAMEAIKESCIDEICATLWHDDGGETDVYTALLGIQLFSEFSYYDSVSDEHLKKMFRICTGYDADSFFYLSFDDVKENEKNKNKPITDPGEIYNTVVASKHTLYQDILQGLFDKHYENVALKEHYTDLYNKLKAAEIPSDLTTLFDYYTQLALVLSLKASLGRDITRNYSSKDKEALRGNLDELDVLYKEFCSLHEKFSALWFEHHKAFGLDRIDLRFGGQEARIQRACSRIKDFLEGNINSIEELEEERLMFSDEEFPSQRGYNAFISASI